MGSRIKPKGITREIGLIILAAAASVDIDRSVAAPRLPVPCATGSCGTGASSPTTWVTSGAATAVQRQNTLTINQSSNKAILNWASFNIDAGGHVIFQQPNASAVALNRIFDANPSSIFGQLSANGQIYLLNANGFIFGATSQVNVGSLIASSLNITDSTFQNGILSSNALRKGSGALQPYTDDLGNPIVNTGSITVQPGAALTANSGGSLLLAAPMVQNGGSLTAPDGQVVLAAGQTVYLQASNTASADTAANLRGFVVEVDSGGTAWNQLTGQLSAPRGNVTLVGLAVNQDGRISATTSVSANGSVFLEAADNASVPSVAGTDLASTNGGTLTIGPSSQMSVLPELQSTATSDSGVVQLQSAIRLKGQQILIKGGQITAPDGNLAVTASADPHAGVVTDGNSNARLRIDSGAVIDLSGSNVELPMDANLLSIQLRGNELADDPTQRNGALRGQTVIIDERVGTNIIGAASLTAAENAVPESVGYRTTGGGRASFTSEGDIVVAQGSTINVSGGSVAYAAGTVQTSQLVGGDGRTYDIGTANPLLAYSGVINPTLTKTFDPWGVQEVVPSGSSRNEAGYVQGSAAGTVQFAAPNIILQGSLLGQATNGVLQRSTSATSPNATPYQIAANSPVAGGTLIIGLPAGLATNTLATDFLAPSVALVAQAPPVVVSDDSPLPGPLTLDLPTAYIANGGFTATRIFSNTEVTVSAGQPLNLNPGGSLTLEAPRINVFSNIVGLGGSVNFQSVQTLASPDPTVQRAGIQVGDSVTIDVRGQWTNDLSNLGAVPAGPTFQNGGSIVLQLDGPQAGSTDPEQLVIGNNVSLRASGGAWQNSAGSLKNGTGGQIVLSAGSLGSAIQVGNNLSLDAFGVNGAAGGSFSLVAPSVDIAAGSAGWTQAQRQDQYAATGSAFQVFSPLFSQYGFSSVSLTAESLINPAATSPDLLTLNAGTAIVAEAQSLQLKPGFNTQASGGTIGGFAQPVTLPYALRPSTQVALTVALNSNAPVLTGQDSVGTLDIQKGSSIQVDPGSAPASGAAITLNAAGSLLMDGGLQAPGGNVLLELRGNYAGAINDPGYLADQRIELGADASIDVSGFSSLTPNNAGLLLGNVAPGGTVSLFADRGFVLTRPGSQIDISGASALLDEPDSTSPTGYSRMLVGSAGGSLSVRSPESISLLGGLTAAAGSSAAGQPAAGTLSVDLSRTENWFSPADSAVPTFPVNALTITLVGDTANTSPSAPDSGQAELGVASLMASGIDALNLKSDTRIAFATDSPLSLTRSLSLDAPVFDVLNGSHAALSAPTIAMGSSQTGCLLGCDPAAGGIAGTLTVSGQFIELFGASVLEDTSAASLNSSGDIQLRYAFLGAANTPASFGFAGSLAVNAARVYPTTETQFGFSYSSAWSSVTTPASDAGTMSIGQTSASPGVPLSVGGGINISAQNIINAGTLMAPFGTITLTASNTIDLAGGSVVSVSADGSVLPFGSTQLGGVQWLDPLTGQVIGAIPNRAIQLNAPSVNFAKNATVDLRGGGDLYAYEWVPGTGGTSDNLSSTPLSQYAGLYAVLPSTVGQYAPFDQNYYSGSSLSAGQNVYLSGVAGLPAGFYPLLPARYALLPGALLIQVQPGYQGIMPGHAQTLTDGTPVIAGYFSAGDTGLRNSAGFAGFAIYPPGFGGQVSQYQNSLASTFFGQQAIASGVTQVNLPADAGQLSFLLTPSLSPNNLNVAGTVLSAAAPGGSGASIDISAPNIAVTGNSTAGIASGSVAISADVLQNWGAGQLVLGGHPSSDGTSIEVESNLVTVGAGANLSADQIILVASQGIDVQTGATLASTSGAAGGKAPVLLPATTSISLTNDPNATANLASAAAFLAVSDRSSPVPVRPAVDPTSPVNSGTLNLETGATLSSQGALSLDAPGTVTLAGTLQGHGASWSLGSNSVAFVGQGTSTDSLQINSTLLGELQLAGAVRVASATSIDLLAPVNLGASSLTGAPTLKALTLIGTTLNNLAGGDSVLGANTLSLQGVDGSPANLLPLNSGAPTLSLVASELDIGSGAINIDGFAQVNARVSGAVVGQGSGALQVAGNLTLTATQITAANLATTMISAPNGTLAINAPAAGSAAPPLASYLGGDLTLAAQTIMDTGSIVVSSGNIALQAQQNLNIGAGGLIDASGVVVHAGTQSVGSAGGNITLSAENDLMLASTSKINVGGALGAPAGNLNLSAGESASVNADLSGSASNGASGGSFTLLTGGLATSFSDLSANLLSGGFTNSIGVRTRSGDLVLASGATTLANQVTLTADTGSIDIAGNLSTFGGAQSGKISLFGGVGVTLESSAQLRADTTGSSGRGGLIELGTTNLGASATNSGTPGLITLEPGSIISALGSVQNGELLLRAPALIGTNDISVGTLGTNIAGIGQVVLEPVMQFFGTASNPVDFGAVQGQVGNYITAASPIIAARLNPQGNTAISIQPGIEIQQTGDFSVDQALDLTQASWRFNNAPVDLSIRASGNLTVNASISDGFQTQRLPVGAGFLATVLTDNEPTSASLRFVAGADLTSANPLAVNAVSAGNFTLAPNTVVRTGTGEIDVVAAGDVVLAGSGASIYTAGVPGAPTTTVRLKTDVFNFPSQGGDLVVRAGEDVVGTPIEAGGAVSLWQLRQGNDKLPAQWGVDLTSYGWNFGTLGGGDLSISAGRDINGITAAAADSLFAGGASGTTYTAAGGVAVRSGRDIDNSQFFVASGQGNLLAGRSFLFSLLNLGNAKVDVEARQDIQIEGVLNPTVLPQGATGSQFTGGFFTYGSNSALNLRSTSGTITLDNSNIAVFLGDLQVPAYESSAYPGSLTASALSQDIQIVTVSGLYGGPILVPSDNGQLALFAARDIVDPSSSTIAMSDAPASDVPTAASPSSGSVQGAVTSLSIVGAVGSGRHAGDSNPVLVTAGRDLINLDLDLPKPATLLAGRDIINLTLTGQNLAPTDDTLISAGRDFIEVADNANNSNSIQLGGPGQLDILAGRNVNLGFSAGISTVGSTVNPNLPTAQGAAVTVLAGLGQAPDNAQFVSSIIEPSVNYQQQLVSYVEAQSGQSGLSVAQADAAFAAFSDAMQRPLIDQVFFTELVDSGREANTIPNAGFGRGYAAIDTLFPNSRNLPNATTPNPYQGDLTMDFSRIYTLSGGTITLLVPGGSLNVGLANAPANVPARGASQLGIVAEGSGDVDIYTQFDVLVNASRIFTLGGGNIAIWSNEGSIDAGRGAKSSVSAPPPQVSINSNGQVTVTVSGAVAGSGIRTIQTEPNINAGNVDLIAPVGTVNAGDAGIGAAGNINIAAQAVIGAGNINFGGSATGVPAQIGSLGASLSAVSNSASGATTAANNAVGGGGAENKEGTQLAQAAIAWLDVFVSGLGEDACKPDDIECLKRQKK